MVQFQPQYEDLELGRARGVSSSLKASRLKTQEDVKFQFESEGRKKARIQLKTGRRSSLLFRVWSAFLFYLGFHWLDEAHHNGGGAAICSTQSTNLNIKLIQNTLTPRIML